MVETDLGEATIAYEDPDEGTVERTVENEHVAYFQDHWILKTGENERGEDVVRRIPIQRVHYVERSVEEFEQEVSTIRDQVQSFADDLRSRLLGGEDGGRRGRERGEASETETVYHIDVESGEAERAGSTRDEPSETETAGIGMDETGTDETEGTEMDELTGTETDENELTGTEMDENESSETDEPDESDSSSR